MTFQRLSHKLTILRKLEQECSPPEQAAIKLLSSMNSEDKIKKVDQLIKLIDSVSILRKLVNSQLRDILLDIRNQHKTSSKKDKPSAESVEPLPKVPTIDEVMYTHGNIVGSRTNNDIVIVTGTEEELFEGLSNSEPSSNQKVDHDLEFLEELEEEERIEKNQPTPKPLAVTEISSPEAFSLLDDAYSPAQEERNDPFNNDMTPQVTDEDFDDLEELKRGVEFLTQPSLEDDSDDDQKHQNVDAESDPFPFALAEDISVKEETPTPEVTPAQEGSLSAEDSGFSSEFPMSAGEAGTAIFGSEQLQEYQRIAEIHDKELAEIENSNKGSKFTVQASTPHLHFIADVVHFTEKELFLVTTESLLAGEEVKLSFQLPQSDQHIECRALVRSKKTSDPEGCNLSLRFLDLRPSQIDDIKKIL